MTWLSFILNKNEKNALFNKNFWVSIYFFIKNDLGSLNKLKIDN